MSHLDGVADVACPFDPPFGRFRHLGRTLEPALIVTSTGSKAMPVRTSVLRTHTLFGVDERAGVVFDRSVECFGEMKHATRRAFGQTNGQVCPFAPA